MRNRKVESLYRRLSSCCVDCADASCLLVSNYSGEMALLNANSSSLLLKLESVERLARCRSVSAPSVQYIVHYHQITSSAPLPVICRPTHTSACHTEVSRLSLPNIVTFVVISCSVFRAGLRHWGAPCQSVMGALPFPPLPFPLRPFPPPSPFSPSPPSRPLFCHISPFLLPFLL